MKENDISVNGIKNILVKRDHLTPKEAEQRIDETTALLQEAVMNGGGLTEAEDILSMELGLEPDYLEALIF